MAVLFDRATTTMTCGSACWPFYSAKLSFTTASEPSTKTFFSISS